MVSMLGWIVFGLRVGALATLVMPGRDPGGGHRGCGARRLARVGDRAVWPRRASGLYHGVDRGPDQHREGSVPSEGGWADPSGRPGSRPGTVSLAQELQCELLDAAVARSEAGNSRALLTTR
jgi:hypothetical protein